MPRSLAIWGMLAGLVLISGLVVSACVDLGPAPTATPRATPTPRPTFTPSVLRTPAGAGSAGCEACHGDKEKLKEVAAAEKDNGAVACKG